MNMFGREILWSVYVAVDNIGKFGTWDCTVYLMNVETTLIIFNRFWFFIPALLIPIGWIVL